ncbi:MAG: Mor transcription activator family protein [Romboutsia sp.]
MKIKKEDVGYNLELLLDIVGEKNFLEISRMYGGCNVYIPTYSSMVRGSRNREIASKYNGVNAADLARMYGLSVNHINRIVGKS